MRATFSKKRAPPLHPSTLCFRGSPGPLMLRLPVYRWGQPYESLEVDEIGHFETGEPVVSIGRANGGLLQRDMRKASQARASLRARPVDELIAAVGRAGEAYMNDTLPMGDGTQSA